MSRVLAVCECAGLCVIGALPSHQTHIIASRRFAKFAYGDQSWRMLGHNEVTAL